MTSPVLCRLIDVFLGHALDILCLSELGEIDRRLDSKLNKTVTNWIKDLLVDSIGGQVSLFQNAHYITIVWKESMIVQEHNFISNFITGQAFRCFQHFRVHLQGNENVITVINCHAPFSENNIYVQTIDKYILVRPSSGK